MTSSSSWRLDGFGPAIDDWKARERPIDAVVEAVIRWTLTRMDDPYVGMRREPNFANLWFGGIPGTIQGDQVVTCSYFVFDRDHVARCNSYATLSMPI